MTTVEVFDPAMCCSTGVCGPSVDPALATFAADLQWAGENGVTVTRYNLAQEPGQFAGQDAVRKLLAEDGEGALPGVVVNGEVRSSGRYPARVELAAWALPGTTVDAPGEAPAELLATSPATLAGAAGKAEVSAIQITELPIVELAAPCCGSGTGEEDASEGTGAAGQAGCCG